MDFRYWCGDKIRCLVLLRWRRKEGEVEITILLLCCWNETEKFAILFSFYGGFDFAGGIKTNRMEECWVYDDCNELQRILSVIISYHVLPCLLLMSFLFLFPLQVLLFPTLANNDRKFNFSITEFEGSQGSFELIQQSTQNGRLLETLGAMPNKMLIQANDDVYEATKARMAVAEEIKKDKW